MSFGQTAKSRPPPDLSISTRILERVAEKEGASPLEFDRLLSDVIDPDALEALFEVGNTSGYIEFGYLGYRIRVESDGQVVVSEHEK